MTTKTACDFEIAMSELAEAQTALQHEFGRGVSPPAGHNLAVARSWALEKPWEEFNRVR